MQAPSNERQTAAMVLEFLDRAWRKESHPNVLSEPPAAFLTQTGKLRVCDLRGFHLAELLDRYPGANYRHNICRAVKTCFKWLADNEYIAASPFTKVPTPPAQLRGDEAYIEPARRAKIIESVGDDDLRDLLEFLRETGCRPQEARILEARHLEGQRAVLAKEESKGGKVQRIVHLTDRASAICRRLTLKHPTGRFFRERGEPWTAKRSAPAVEHLDSRPIPCGIAGRPMPSCAVSICKPSRS